MKKLATIILLTSIISCSPLKEQQVKMCQWTLKSKCPDHVYGKNGWWYEWLTCDDIKKYEFTQMDYYQIGTVIINRDDK